MKKGWKPSSLQTTFQTKKKVHVTIWENNSPSSCECRDPGRQRMLDSVASFILNENKHVLTWDTRHLDQVLKNGDWLSVNHGLVGQCPLVSDIPNTLWLNGTSYKIQIVSSDYGPFESEEFPINVQRLGYLLNKDTYFIMTTGDTNPGYCCAIIRCENEQYCVFDPHGRRTQGRPETLGKATLTEHSKTDLEQFFF